MIDLRERVARAICATHSRYPPQVEGEWQTWLDEADAAIAAGVGAVPAWQPIETAPRDGSEVLLWDRDIAGCDIGVWSAQAGCWINDSHGIGLVQQQIHLPSHWMSLPTPPAAAEEG